ncbi:hypothetical protein CXP39_03340 [Mesoplasma syrphidae]|uniref:Tetraspanin family protein n=1 Tax=Mesoplasma syrphidae TaxID=225999 RepID=A0A2K9BKQ0_9MOLU|nr:hypothetical protein [Mesoplasma syrphidae]AUF83801.1 hypothetical protein CXP39_03340 [Mesoplasma syrphidae]
MALTKKEQRQIARHDQRKWQFNGTFKTGIVLILIFSGIGLMGSALMFFMGLVGIVIQNSLQNGNTSSINLSMTSAIILAFFGAYIFTLTAVSLTMASFTLSNQTTSTKMILAIVAIGSGICMLGGIVMLLTPHTDVKEVEAIELNNEVRILEEVVEQTLNKEQVHNRDEREQRIYEAKYAKAVEFLEQIENKEIDEEKLVEKFSSDFKVIFLQAKRDMIVEGKIQDKTYNEELAQQLAHEQNENLIVINKEISDNVLDKIDDSEWTQEANDEKTNS